MREVNREEERLQRELMNLHLKNLHKHAVTIQRHRIDTTIRCTEDLLRRIVEGVAATRRVTSEPRQLLH